MVNSYRSVNRAVDSTGKSCQTRGGPIAAPSAAAAKPIMATQTPAAADWNAYEPSLPWDVIFWSAYQVTKLPRPPSRNPNTRNGMEIDGRTKATVAMATTPINRTQASQSKYAGTMAGTSM